MGITQAHPCSFVFNAMLLHYLNKFNMDNNVALLTAVIESTVSHQTPPGPQGRAQMSKCGSDCFPGVVFSCTFMAACCSQQVPPPPPLTLHPLPSLHSSNQVDCGIATNVTLLHLGSQNFLTNIPTALCAWQSWIEI